MKKIICLFAIAFLLVSAQTDAAQAENLLQSLYQDAVDNLQDLQDNWSVNGGLLQANVDSWQSSLDTQTQECDLKAAILQEVTEQQQENEFKLQWVADTIKQKVDQSQKLYDDRCAANRSYIHGLKNDKILLRLIEFLRQALEAKEDMSLVQRKEFTQTFMRFISLMHSNNTKELLTMHTSLKQEADPNAFDVETDYETQTRTDEEVGTGHVDDNRDQIEVDSYESGTRRPFSEYKADLLALLEEFETEVRNKMVEHQEAEVQAGIAAAEFRIHLDKELQELDRELYAQVELKAQLSKKQREAAGESQACDAVLEEVIGAFQEAQGEYDAAFAKFSDKEAEINDEVEIFEEVLELYKSNLSGEEYREQLDDFTADGSYEGDYNDREVDEIDFVNDQEEGAGEEQG